MAFTVTHPRCSSSRLVLSAAFLLGGCAVPTTNSEDVREPQGPGKPNRSAIGDFWSLSPSVVNVGRGGSGEARFSVVEPDPSEAAARKLQLRTPGPFGCLSLSSSNKLFHVPIKPSGDVFGRLSSSFQRPDWRGSLQRFFGRFLTRPLPEELEDPLERFPPGLEVFLLLSDWRVELPRVIRTFRVHQHPRGGSPIQIVLTADPDTPPGLIKDVLDLIYGTARQEHLLLRVYALVL